jgi:hypothetical protein
MEGWLKIAKEMSLRTALRRGDLRADMRVRLPSRAEVGTDEELYVLLHQFMTVATVRGLDVIGVISDWLRPGQVAQYIAQQKHVDIFPIPGIELVTAEGIGVLAYNIPQEIPNRLTLEDMLKKIKDMGGFSIIVQPSKRWTQRINKIITEEWAPAAIEIWCEGLSREYFDEDIEPEYLTIVTSGADTPTAFQETYINTRIQRKWFTDIGVMEPEAGKEFTPEYLQEYNPAIPGA